MEGHPVLTVLTDYVGVAVILLTIAAVVSIMRTASLQDTLRILWVAIVVVLPLIGPVAWFISRRSLSRPSAAAHP